MRWPGHRFVAGLFAFVLVAWFGVMFAVMREAALPPTASGTMLAVFPPGTDSDEAFAAITAAGAKPIRRTAFGFIWVVNGEAGKLVAQGATGAYRELPIPAEIAGCVAAADAKIAQFGL